MKERVTLRDLLEVEDVDCFFIVAITVIGEEAMLENSMSTQSKSELSHRVERQLHGEGGILRCVRGLATGECSDNRGSPCSTHGKKDNASFKMARALQI